MSVKLSKKIMSQLGRTNATFGLIEEGDKILVGLSGGKDSLTMIHAMKSSAAVLLLILISLQSPSLMVWVKITRH